MSELILSEDLKSRLVTIRKELAREIGLQRLPGATKDPRRIMDAVGGFEANAFRQLVKGTPAKRNDRKTAAKILGVLEGSWQPPRSMTDCLGRDFTNWVKGRVETEHWRSTARALRHALGYVDTGHATEAPADDPEIRLLAGDPPPDGAEPDRNDIRLPGEAVNAVGRSSILSRRVISIPAVMVIPVGLVLLTWLWLRAIPAEPRTACLALERTSISALAAHRALPEEAAMALPAPDPARPNPWALDLLTPVPLPAPDPARPNPIVMTIGDPTDGGPVRSIFTTSQFSFEEGTNRHRPGGGKADPRLRVGGYGDTYLSLLRFPLPSNRLVRRAVIRLVVLGDAPDMRPTTMTLRVVNDPWRVVSGPDPRLWWRDCPRSEVVRRHLPAPGARGSNYDIDITDIYNLWVRRFHPNEGIILEPEYIGRYSWSPEHYGNFSTFYSTRADPANRPKLILQY